MDAYIEPHNQSPALSPAESTFNSDCSSSSSKTSGGAGYPEIEVMLASKNPKKRAGRKKFKETRHPVYRGVRKRNSDKWVCEVRRPDKKSRVWLGTYPTAEMAARAHDVAVLALRGPSACLNFADSVWRLRLPESCNVKDIQKAAAEAAEAFREIENDEMNVVVGINELQEDVVYIDEEEVFGLPGFFAGMAEGLMVPPPWTVGYDNFMDMDNVEFYGDLSLWSY